MRACVFVTFLVLAGCAGSIEKVQAMRAEAPEWYEARKLEFRGEGYPDINTVPPLSSQRATRTSLALSEAETLAVLEQFNADPRSEGAIETPEEMRAWALQVRRAVEGQLPAPDFLTDAEVEAIRARFDVARARL
jgi:hypothetical protein